MAFSAVATEKSRWNHGGCPAFLCQSRQPRTFAMLNWAVTFLVIALIAAVFGFGGIVSAAVGIAKLLFFIFIVLFAISLIMSLVSGRRV
jgi:uncharacterized membrane protein YtjA (UPF0391 family)